MHQKKNLKIILLILFLSLLTSGCSKNFSSRDNVFLQGKVRILQTARELVKTPTRIDSNNLLKAKKINLPYITPTTAPFKPNTYIVKLTNPLPRSDVNKLLKGYGKVVKKIGGEKTYQIKVTTKDDNEFISYIQSRKEIAYLEPDHTIHIQGQIPSDPAYKQQWNLKMLGLETTWSKYRGSRAVTVAVIDTGILPGHPDLRDNILQGYDFIDNDTNPVDTDTSFSHGTHVAGIIGAVTNNGLGVAGINWEVSILPIRVIGPGGSGGYSALIAGIYKAVEMGANIINLSLAGTVDSPTLHEAVKYAVNNNVTVIAAAGNNNDTPILYPARYPEVISVGAVGPTKKRAFYSNYGPELDLVAPGGDSTIYSTNHNLILSTSGYMGNSGPVHEYTLAQGTSMATPHVTASAAILYSTGITDPQGIRDNLLNNTDDLGPPGRDNMYGAGLVNINKILGLEKIAKDDNDDSPPVVNTNLKAKLLITSLDGSASEKTIITDKTGEFSLYLKPGSWQITGWIDVNQNNKVDNGDYYGSSQVNLQHDKDNFILDLVEYNN